MHSLLLFTTSPWHSTSCLMVYIQKSAGFAEKNCSSSLLILRQYWSKCRAYCWTVICPSGFQYNSKAKAELLRWSSLPCWKVIRKDVEKWLEKMKIRWIQVRGKCMRQIFWTTHLDGGFCHALYMRTSVILLQKSTIMAIRSGFFLIAALIRGIGWTYRYVLKVSLFARIFLWMTPFQFHHTHSEAGLDFRLALQGPGHRPQYFRGSQIS